MHCLKKVTDDIVWVGANDRRLAMFEGVYSVPYGVSYNSYLLMDEKTVLFDTVDKAVQQRFLENVAYALNGRPLDYLIIQHMEPDHSAALAELLLRYPNVKVVCNAKTLNFIKQFFNLDVDAQIVKENDTLNTGKHTLHFIMAPMVHWPEVMVTYDSTDKTLFSADAFGSFGALNGAIFADEVDFNKDYLDETRRYYANIVGKYGTQVQSLLNKASALPIDMICPLHGFVWRKNLHEILTKYSLWSRYQPEEQGVMIAYASVYGNTENAAEILACRLRDNGIKTVMFDVSVTPASEIIAAAFRWSHLVFASITYNAGIFVSMDSLLADLVAHNIQNRTVAVIENGSWAATSGNLISAKLENCKNINLVKPAISIQSSLKAAQVPEIEAMAETIATGFLRSEANVPVGKTAPIDTAAMSKLSYGLFVLTVKDGQKENGCIIDTVLQVSLSPERIVIAVRKTSFTLDMVSRSGEFNISILTESAPFSIFKQFGFASGRDSDKFANCDYDTRTANGIRYIPRYTNGVISATVTGSYDCGTHVMFLADVSEAVVLSVEPSMTYQYYFDRVKQNSAANLSRTDKKGFVCKVCGYIYEGDTLPIGYICPVCQQGADVFEPL